MTDIVKVKNFLGVGNVSKFGARYSGPFKIIKISWAQNAYLVQSLWHPNTAPVFVNYRNLRYWTKRDPKLELDDLKLPSDIDSDAETLESIANDAEDEEEVNNELLGNKPSNNTL